MAAIADKVSRCKKCQELVVNRIKTVPGEGNPNAKIVLIGEGPGQSEAEQGIPFVGRAGKLLNNILQACNLKREEVYILNIVKCRPPGNRTPLPEEVKNCRPFLDLQLKVIRPTYIVCLGAVAAQNLLAVTTPISVLRGEWREYRCPEYTAKVLCTYHPSYLLRNPSAKKDTWEDMKMLLKDLEGGT